MHGDQSPLKHKFNEQSEGASNRTSKKIDKRREIEKKYINIKDT